MTDAIKIPEKGITKLDTTECDKMLAVQDKSQTIGDFLEWLQSGKADDSEFKRPLFLATYGVETGYYNKLQGTYEDLPEEEWKVDMDKIRTYTYSTEKLLAKFFDIDLDKVDKERQGLLKQLPG